MPKKMSKAKGNKPKHFKVDECPFDYPIKECSLLRASQEYANFHMINYAKQKQIELLEKVLKELDKDTFGFYEYQNDRDRQKLERWLEQELKKLKEVK